MKEILLTLLMAIVSQLGVEVTEPIIVEENGYMVVQDNDDERQTIVCKLDVLEEHGFYQYSNNPEFACVNEFDSSDVVIVEDEESQFKINDVVFVTFFHDDVESVHQFKSTK